MRFYSESSRSSSWLCRGYNHQCRKTAGTVTKIWEDNSNQDGIRPETVTIDVYADVDANVLSELGFPLPAVSRTTSILAKSVELSGDNAVTENDVVNTDKWAATIDLPAKTLTGSPINYTIAEQGAVTNNGVTTLPIDGSDKAYKVKYDQDSLTVTNSYEPETISINVEKYWKDSDNQDGKRPESITVRVMNGEDEAATAIVKPDENGSWKHQFADLPKYANSQLICYTIAEDKVNNYSTETIAQPDMDEETNTYTVAITNTYTPETVTVEVNKIWDDKNNQDGKRPNAVTFQLYKQVGDEETAVKVDGRILTLSATDGNWTTEDLKGTFGSLPKCENGQEITYSVVENKVDGYTSVVGAIADGEITVTNTHTPETITISGEKNLGRRFQHCSSR